MVSAESVEKQLKRIHFNQYAWGRTEVRELHNILLPDEEVYECVNGIYEGGFALLLATDVRVLLVDKKPMNYLTVEDLRFDMINELDYSHRLIGAQISISAGSKYLKFKSYNQPRLRRLIDNVQRRMDEIKKRQSEHQEDQNLHLEQINQQLQAYLLAQHQNQMQLQQQMTGAKEGTQGKQAAPPPEPLRPSPELSDYLFAQSLLTEFQQQSPADTVATQPAVQQLVEPAPIEQHPQFVPIKPQPQSDSANAQMADLYAEGMREIYGRRTDSQPAVGLPAAQPVAIPPITAQADQHAIEVNPLRIAYSKLPMALRNRKFGRPSFHAHSQQTATVSPSYSQPAPTIAR